MDLGEPLCQHQAEPDRGQVRKALGHMDTHREKPQDGKKADEKRYSEEGYSSMGLSQKKEHAHEEAQDSDGQPMLRP